MEMIQYTPPVSWDDKGMDWESPDPGNVDYYRAILEAVIERAILTSQNPNEVLYSIIQCRPWSIAAINAIRDAIYRLAPNFVNMEFDDYKDDLSDFPKMWSYHELIDAEGCRICEHPGTGSCNAAGWAEWLKAVKNAINKLTAVNFSGVSGTYLSRSGSEHDPPFSESISTALREALEGEPYSGTFSSFPQEFYSWSGNTDYKKNSDVEKGYCGYAQSRSIVIKTSQRPHPTAECDLIFRYKVSAPTGALSYSSELQKSVLDLGSSGLDTGIHTIRTHWSPDMELDISIGGNVNDIPRNSSVPVSDYRTNYDSNGNVSGYSRTLGRSCKTGYEGVAYCILDFAVENGFRFQ